MIMKREVPMRIVLLIGLFTCIEVTSFTRTLAGETKYPFSGFYAYGVSPEAIKPADLELACLLLPGYSDESGRAFSFKLDLPFFRETGKFRYRRIDSGSQSKYDSNTKIVVSVPTKKFDGNPYYAPRISFHAIKTVGEFGYTFVSFRDLRALKYALKTRDEHFGDRGALLKCPFADAHYMKLAQDDPSLPSLSESEAAENVDILYNLKPNPDLVKKIVAAKNQLQ
jgi:hypothetical protein